MPNSPKTIEFELKKEIYSKGVLLRVAYRYLEDYYVFLNSDSANWKIAIRPKKEKENFFTEENKTKLNSEFQSHLINEEFRESLLENTKSVKQLIVSRALFGATYASLDGGQDGSSSVKKPFDEKEFFADDEIDDYVEDPLQISAPWEERFGKKE